ncbi:MAG: MBL fold metallo-hydrolase [Sinimarinibacterium sp.]|jgi:L-ascorbate metabolism protein UlaG (beta-lactamase superfamily)
MNRPFRWVLRAGLVLSVLAAVAATWLLVLRPQRDARLLEARTTAVPAVAPTEMTATWFGTTAVLLRAGDDALMIDPFFTRPPGLWPLLRNAEIAPDQALIERWLKKAGVTQLQAVLVSHSHYDHALDAGVVARLTGAKLIGSSSTASIGRGAGLAEDRILVAAPEQPISLGPFTVRFIESRHAGATGGAPTGDITAPLIPPAHYLDYRQGGTWSILVEHAGGTVLHHGSAGFVPGALRGYRADMVVLGAALVDDAEAYLRQTVDAVAAQRVMLTHWDDFTRGLERPLRPMPVVVDLAELLTALDRRRDVRVMVPVLAQSVPVRGES